MSGQIHFVTPTNRWIGSIPLSTLDPLTLEPLSTYVRSDPAAADSVSKDSDDEHENRRVNISGKVICSALPWEHEKDEVRLLTTHDLLFHE